MSNATDSCSPCGGMWRLTGRAHGVMRKVIAMRNRYEAAGRRQAWMGIIVILATLLLATAVPGHTWGGAHGFRGAHGFGGFHRFGGFHGFGGPRIAIGIGPLWGPYWGPYPSPYAYPYAYPPVVAAPSTQVYVQPSPPASVQPPPPQSFWYYCDHPSGYYPYVQQCPGGWRPVTPTPP
jgi:hypothetical protein